MPSMQSSLMKMLAKAKFAANGIQLFTEWTPPMGGNASDAGGNNAMMFLNAFSPPGGAGSTTSFDTYSSLLSSTSKCEALR